NIARAISLFDSLYSDLLGGKPLPAATSIVLGGNAAFVAIAAVIPAFALGALLTRRVVTGIYVLSVLVFVTLVELGFIFTTLLSPLITVTKQMGLGGCRRITRSRLARPPDDRRAVPPPHAVPYPIAFAIAARSSASDAGFASNRSTNSDCASGSSR